MLKRNSKKGYTAELIDFPDLFSGDKATKKIVSISRDEFLKVLVGSITVDTPDLIQYYFTINPAALKHANTHLAFGVALLHWSDDRFVERSIRRYENRMNYSGRPMTRNRSNTALTGCISLS